MDRFALSRNTILEAGKPVATITPQADSDTGLRLVGLLNLQERDDRLLQQIADLIASRDQ